MFTHELVIRHIVIQGSDQIIPVAPCVRDIVVPFVAVRFRKSHDIQPVPRKPFAELRRCQQAIDQMCIRAVVVLLAGFNKRCDIIWLRRQASQYKTRTADQCFRRRQPDWRNPLGPHSMPQKPIDRRAVPCDIHDFRHWWISHRLQTPPLTSLSKRLLPRLPNRRPTDFRAWVERTALHPGFEIRNLRRRQLAAGVRGRHLQIRIIPVDGLDEQTRSQIVRHNRGPGISTAFPASF